MWFLTMHRWVGDQQEAMALLDEHLTWMRVQQRAGHIIAAGPTPDRALGIMIFGHMSRDDLDAICADEPFIKAGFRTYDVHAWDVHHLLGIGGFDRTTVEAMMASDSADEPVGGPARGPSRTSPPSGNRTPRPEAPLGQLPQR